MLPQLHFFCACVSVWHLSTQVVGQLPQNAVVGIFILTELYARWSQDSQVVKGWNKKKKNKQTKEEKKTNKKKRGEEETCKYFYWLYRTTVCWFLVLLLLSVRSTVEIVVVSGKWLPQKGARIFCGAESAQAETRFSTLLSLKRCQVLEKLQVVRNQVKSNQHLCVIVGSGFDLGFTSHLQMVFCACHSWYQLSVSLWLQIWMRRKTFGSVQSYRFKIPLWRWSQITNHLLCWLKSNRLHLNFSKFWICPFPPEWKAS